MRSAASVLAITAMLTSACTDAPARNDTSAAAVDSAYLTQDLWNDGQAEVAFYEVERSRNQYGEPVLQSFTVGTYLVKHNFDRSRQTKADAGGGAPAFKYALFYELESGSYEYKRHYVVNARQHDLLPLKHSFSSFDWCSNVYREQAFLPSGSVDYLARSDDYGNEAGSFEYAGGTYPPALIPLFIRGLDFTADSTRAFSVLLLNGDTVPATATRVGLEQVQSPEGEREVEHIRVRYDRAVPSPVGEDSDLEESYWRGTDAARTLVALEGSTGRYRMTLVEDRRSAYWDENIYPNLSHVTERP